MSTATPDPTDVAKDSALRNPLFANLFNQYGKEWERNMNSELRQELDWHRTIGTHASITGFATGDPRYATAGPNARFAPSELKFIIT